MTQITLLQKITFEAFFGYKIEFSTTMGDFFTIKVTKKDIMPDKTHQYKQVLGKDEPSEEQIIKCIDYMIDEIRKRRSEDQ